MYDEEDQVVGYDNYEEENDQQQEVGDEEDEVDLQPIKRRREYEEEEEEEEDEEVSQRSHKRKKVEKLPPVQQITALIVEAINKGDLIKLKQLLAGSLGEKAVNGQICGNTPLMYAAFYGHLDVCRYLIERGGKLDVANSNGATALMWAVKERRSLVVKLLLEKKANVNLKDNQGLTALHYAVKLTNSQEAFQMVTLLTDAGADVNICGVAKEEKNSSSMCSTVLHEAAYLGNTDILRVLVENGADLDKVDSMRRSALHKATARNHYQAVKELLDCGADPNIQDCSGRTPLMSACFFGFVKIVALLLDHEADPLIYDNSNETAETITKRRQTHASSSINQPNNWSLILTQLTNSIK